MKLTQINAQIVADSISPKGHRLTSLLITFPRFILAEINTHRMLSKNTSSSRAIPFNKMVESIKNDPFIPIAWQKEHKGMQGSEYFTEKESQTLKIKWLKARNSAIDKALDLSYGVFNEDELFKYNSNGELVKEEGVIGVTKQICNRLLEPFMWTTMLITGNVSDGGWSNFFNLRCPQYEYYDMLTGNQQFFKSKKDWLQYYNNKPLPKAKHISKIPENDIEWLQINKGQAEIHIMDLAEKIYDAMNESIPNSLLPGEWHVPFANKINGNTIDELIGRKGEVFQNREYRNLYDLTRVKISTAMAARTSYTVVGDEKEINYKRMIELHNRLINADPIHASPMEHCVRVMIDYEYERNIKGEIIISDDGKITIPDDIKGWCRNYRGFIQYRHLIENETV